jgi:hypothetical protein
MEEILSQTRTNFENQLKEVDAKIVSVSSELEKLKEYKLKLLGGIETLELISPKETSEETSTEN